MGALFSLVSPLSNLLQLGSSALLDYGRSCELSTRPAELLSTAYIIEHVSRQQLRYLDGYQLHELPKRAYSLRWQKSTPSPYSNPES